MCLLFVVAHSISQEVASIQRLRICYLRSNIFLILTQHIIREAFPIRAKLTVYVDFMAFGNIDMDLFGKRLFRGTVDVVVGNNP